MYNSAIHPIQIPTARPERIAKNGSNESKNNFDNTNAPNNSTPAATYVEIFNAFDGFYHSFERTNNCPKIEAIIPIAAIANGKVTPCKEKFFPPTVTAIPKEIADTIEPT